METGVDMPVRVIRVEGHDDYVEGLQERLQDRFKDYCLNRITSISISVHRDGWLAVTAVGTVDAGGECPIRIAIFTCQAANAEFITDNLNEWISEERINPETFKTNQVEAHGALYLVAVGTKI